MNHPAHTKTCSKCHVEKPATTEYFGAEKRGTFGLRGACKSCIKEQRREYRLKNKASIAATKKAYNQANKEAIALSARNWRQRNQEKIREYNREYNELNKEKLSAKKKVYRKVNKPQVSAYDKQWRKNHPEIMRVRGTRRRARKRSLPDTFTIHDWLGCLEYFNYCCAVCGSQLRDLFGNVEPHADHWIPLAHPDCIGTVKENMVCLCNNCNLTKSAKLPEQWLVEKFGKHKAIQVMERVRLYFESLRE